jgi:hypothetical protein
MDVWLGLRICTDVKNTANKPVLESLMKRVYLKSV